MEYKHLPNENIIEQCINKNPLAWAEFYTRFNKLVRFVIRKNFRKFDANLDSSHIEDILQDIFLTLWHKDKLSQIRNRNRINYWLIAVTTNTTIEYITRHGRHTAKIEAIDDSILDAFSDSKQNPSDDFIENEKSDLLQKFVNTLNNNEQLIAKMKFMFLKPNKEISEILNLPIGTISGTITRIKPKFKKFMKGSYE